MADKAISELTAAERIKSTDLFVLEQDGAAKRLQGQVLLNWLTAAADGHGGISDITKTGTSGLVDTYTITLADKTTKAFAMTNGNGLTKLTKVSTSGLVDNYRFTRTDGTYFAFSVTNGAKGDKGDNSYVWIKYASQQPTASSHSMGDSPDDWIGVYSGAKASAPTDWQEYKWFQIKGERGDTGLPATVVSSAVEYLVSDSGNIVPAGSWSTDIPNVAQGRYLWTRVTTRFNTGNPAVSYSVSRIGLDGKGSVVSINGRSPGSDGNVALLAKDIATASGESVQDSLSKCVLTETQALTDAKKATARDNIGAATSSHNHDTRYYTESEMDTKLSGKSDTGHDHMGQTINPAGIELFPGTTAGHGGYIDFHYDNNAADYTSRIIEAPSGYVQLNGEGIMTRANIAAAYNVQAQFIDGIFEYSNSVIKAGTICFAQFRGGLVTSSFRDTALSTSSNAGMVKIVAKNGETFKTNLNILMINL